MEPSSNHAFTCMEHSPNHVLSFTESSTNRIHFIHQFSILLLKQLDHPCDSLRAVVFPRVCFPIINRSHFRICFLLFKCSHFRIRFLPLNSLPHSLSTSSRGVHISFSFIIPRTILGRSRWMQRHKASNAHMHQSVKQHSIPTTIEIVIASDNTAEQTNCSVINVRHCDSLLRQNLTTTPA